MTNNTNSFNSEPGKIGKGNSDPSARYRGIYWDSPGSTKSDQLYSATSSLHKDFSNLKFNRCKTKLCKTCPKANSKQLTLDKNKSTFCKVYNCIYKITCTICNMSYIGQTKNHLHLRINLHRSNINNYKKDLHANSNDNNFEYEHFNLHGVDNIEISILKIVKNYHERIFCENGYLNSMRTVFPYGLNQIYNNRNVVNIHLKTNFSPIFNMFMIKENCNNFKARFKRGKNKTKCKTPTVNDITQLETQFVTDFNYNRIKTWLFSIKKRHIALVYDLFINCQDLNLHFKHTFLDLIIVKAIKLHISLNSVTLTQTKYSRYCVIHYSNKELNNIKFNQIFHKYSNLLPIKNVKVLKAFKYSIPMGRKIFNYNKISREIDLDNDTNDNCLCDNSEFSTFINSHYGHILTGDINIVKDLELRKIMSYGTKYRLPIKYGNSASFKLLKMDIEKFIYSMACQNSVPVEAFAHWKYKVLENFKSNLHCKKEYFDNHKIQNSIRDLQKFLTIVYIDKCASNYAFICQKLYKNLLKTELNNCTGLTKINSSSTIVTKKIIALYKQLKISNNNYNFPYMVLIPKFHKTPITFRTVTVEFNTYTNKAASKLLSLLKIVNEEIVHKKYNIYIKNSFELIEEIKQFPKIYEINTYDFKDLFNCLNIKDLYSVMVQLFKEYKDIVALNVNINFFKKLLNMVLFNNYIKHGNHIFHKATGIPQGNSASTLLSNLYLFYYERNYEFENYLVRRFVDDIITFKTSLYANKFDPYFYPKELKLISNVSTYNEINFLDIKFILNNNRLTTDLYDKRTDYNFSMTALQDFSSNLHISVYRNIISNFVNRINKICSKQFKTTHLVKFKQKLLKLGYPNKILHFITQ